MKSKIFFVILGTIMTSLCIFLLIIEFTISKIIYLASWIIWTSMFVKDLRRALYSLLSHEYEQIEKGGLN